MGKYKGVLFDYDGVIAVTMGDNFAAWMKAFMSYGIKIKKDDYFPLEGLGPNDIALQILRAYRQDINLAQQIAQAKADIYKKNTEGKGVKIYPFVSQALLFLSRRKIPTALVTGAKRDRLEHSIPELIRFFNYIVAAHDKIDGEEIKGKPAPDPYLLAARKLDLNPKDCIAVENATLGIESAKLAGCYCVALTTTVGERELKRADKVFKSHKQLLEYFQKVFK